MLKLNTSWEAIYSDGTSLKQFNSDGTENEYVDIEREKITQFVLYRNKNPVVVIHLGGGKRLIYRMRRAMNSNGYEEAVYLAGWQERINDRNTQIIMFLFENNSIEIVDRFYENHVWFYAINFLPDEKI